MPLLTAMVSHAMKDAVELHAKKQKVTMSDVVVGALRNAGFERDEVLKALQRGESVDIDVRRRSASSVLNPIRRVHEYIADKGCVRPIWVSRNLHLKMDDVRRGLDALFAKQLVHEKPFDRPRIIHWTATCKCKTALAGDDRRKRV